MGLRPWTLAAFPQGYELFLHKSPRRQQNTRSSAASRRDFLLYGTCVLNPHTHTPIIDTSQARRTSRSSHRHLNLYPMLIGSCEVHIARLIRAARPGVGASTAMSMIAR